MNAKDLRDKRRQLHEGNKAYGDMLQSVPADKWPLTNPMPTAVWRSRHYLVQGYEESGGETRLSICRTELGNNGLMKDGLTWDELQEIKNGCGFASFDAVEVFPRQWDIVNVANMRHLWVLPEKLPFAWRAAVNERTTV